MTEQKNQPRSVDTIATTISRTARRLSLLALTAATISCTPPIQNSPSAPGENKPLPTFVPTASPLELAGKTCWYRNLDDGRKVPDGYTNGIGECPTASPHWEETTP